MFNSFCLQVVIDTFIFLFHLYNASCTTAIVICAHLLRRMLRKIPEPKISAMFDKVLKVLFPEVHTLFSVPSVFLWAGDSQLSLLPYSCADGNQWDREWGKALIPAGIPVSWCLLSSQLLQCFRIWIFRH